MTRLLSILLVGALCALSGCVTLQPWERGLLNSRLMADPADPLATLADGHVDGAREAIAGAEGASADACGCN